MTNSGRVIIGRDKEKQLFSDCLENALRSKGKTISIFGEAGIGKSTLVDYIKSLAEDKGMAICVGESTPQDLSIPYKPIQTALASISTGEIFQTEEFAYFDEVFLISKIGLLISHVSRLKKEGMDEDILGSMLTAVQDFVKDSFGGGESEAQKGGLGKLEYMNTKIFIEHGDLVYLAVVTSGEEHPDMKKDIKNHLSEIEANYFDILADWDGDIDALSGSIDILNSLAGKRYRVKRSLENINIQSERLKVQNQIHELIESHAQERGLLLVLEDIHWADESTLLAIPFIARNISQNRVLLCLTYRPDVIDSQPGSKDLIERLESEEGSFAIKLESLENDDIVKLASNILNGEKPPEELISNLRSETQGNPFFVTEAIRALVAEGTLVRDREIWVLRHGPKSSVPKTVVELVSKRLESLELDALRLLEYGAILGRRFSIDLLASGFKMPDSYIRELAGQLVSMNLLASAGQDEVMFQHSKTQEVIYEEMNVRWKRMFHKRAGLTYETLFSDNKEDALFNLAYHFSRTLEFDKGIDYCVSAGYMASNNLAPREASQFFEKAVELIEETEREDDRYLEITQMLGELYELDGNYEKSLAIMDKILGKSEDDFCSANALMMKGRVMQSQGKYDDAIDNYENGITLAEKSEQTLLKAKINGYLGKIYLRKGEYERALELQQIYLNESKKAGDPREIGQAYMNMGGVYWHMNDQPMAIRQWEDALKIFEETGFYQGIANTNDNLGVGYSTIGNFEKSLEHYRASEEIMKKIGDVRGMSMVLLNIGVLHDRMGEHEKSLDYYRRSLQIKRKIGDIIGAANIYNNIGAAYFDMGQFEKAEDNYCMNLELVEKLNDTWGISRALQNLAELKIDLGEIDDANALCERSMEIAKEHLFRDILSSDLMLKGIMVSLAGDYEAADALFKESLDMAIEVEDPQRIGLTHLSMARSMLKRNEKEKALDSFSMALKIFEESKMETLARKTMVEMRDALDSTLE